MNVKSIHQFGMPNWCHTDKIIYTTWYLLAQSQYFSAAAHHFCTEILKSQLKPQERENSDNWHSLTRELQGNGQEWISLVQPATLSPPWPCPVITALLQNINRSWSACKHTTKQVLPWTKQRSLSSPFPWLATVLLPSFLPLSDIHQKDQNFFTLSSLRLPFHPCAVLPTWTQILIKHKLFVQHFTQ